MINAKLNNEKEIQKRLGAAGNQARKVLERAMRRTITSTKKEISVAVREKYVIKAGDVKGALKSSKPMKRGNTVTALLEFRGGTIDIFKFKTNPSSAGGWDRSKKRPFKAGVKKGGMKKIPNAFVAKGVALKRPSGDNRHGQIGKAGWTMAGPSVPQMVGSKEVLAKVERKSSETLQKRIEAEIGAVLGGHAK